MTYVLQTVGAISLISGLLALLLSIANKTIANYGEKKLTINEEKEYIMEGGDTLLSGLLENEIFLPSACGGKGSCGYCKCKVVEGGGEILPTELGYVTEEERKEGIRLSCQLKVKEDLKLEIPEEYLSVKQYEATVGKMIDVTDKIKHLRIDLPPGENMEFKPGQYIQILTPEYKNSDEEVYRAYSIASAPTHKDYVELFIGYIPDGVCTTYIHNYLSEGDKIKIIGPFGDFFYQDTGREMVMAAIGTGMAPIMSILRYMRDNDIHRKATFYFSARTRADLYMVEELQEITKKIPEIKIVMSLTRPTPECNWEGDEGRVTDTLEEYVGDASEKEAYLCGSPKMIDAVVDILKDKGMPEEHIYYDKFE